MALNELGVGLSGTISQKTNKCTENTDSDVAPMTLQQNFIEGDSVEFISKKYIFICTSV